jgi:uncharacterized protein YoxC
MSTVWQDWQTLVVVLIAFLFILFGFWVIKIVKNHSRLLSSTLRRVEDIHLKPEGLEDALVRISNILAIIKVKTRLIFKKGRRGREKIESEMNELLGKFAVSVKDLTDFVNVNNLDYRREIRRLYSSTRMLRDKAVKNLAGVEPRSFMETLHAVIGFIHREFPGLIDKADKQADIEAFKEIEGPSRKPGSFTDLFKAVSLLVKQVKEESRQEYIQLKIRLENVEKELEEIEANLSRVLSIEYNRKSHIEIKLDRFIVEFYHFQSEMVAHLDKGLTGPGGKPVKPETYREINEALAEIEQLIDFIGLDYRKYSRITAGLEKLNERFTSVLDLQARHLESQKQALEVTVSSLEKSLNKFAGDGIRQMIDKHDAGFEAGSRRLEESTARLAKVADDAAAEMRQKINQGLEAQAVQDRKKNKEMQNLLETLRDSLRSSVKKLDQEVSKILADQDTRLEERDRRVQTIMEEGVTAVHAKLETEYVNLRNKLDEKINEKINRLEKVLSSASGKIETLFREQAEMFEKHSREVYDIVARMKNDSNSCIEKYRDEFAEFRDLQDGLMEKQKKLMSEIQDDVDANIEKFKADIEGLLDQQISLLEKQKSVVTDMQSGANSGMEKFKQDLGKIVEDQAKSLTHSSRTLEHFMSRLEKMPWFTDNSEKMKLLIDYINKNLHLNVSQQDAHIVIRRIEGEPAFSSRYRKSAIALIDDLLLLEKLHKSQWYWQFLDTIKGKLEASIVRFYNRKGKTIYDSYLGGEGEDALYGLENINKELLLKIIINHHWGAIWSPLLCWAGFFNAYFGEPLADLCTVLDYNARNITGILQDIDCRVDAFKPMQTVPASLTENGDIKEVDEPYIFYKEIVHNIKNSEKITKAREIAEQKTDGKLIMYVEQLGLVHHGERLCESKVVFYSPVSMKHFE